MEQAVNFFKNYLGQMASTTGMKPEELLAELDSQETAASQQLLTQLTVPKNGMFAQTDEKISAKDWELLSQVFAE